MQRTLERLHSVYGRVDVADYVKSLIDHGPEASVPAITYLTFITSVACLIKIAQRREQLSSCNKDILRKFLRDEQLTQTLDRFLAEVAEMNDPAAILSCLTEYMSTTKTLQDYLDEMQASV